MRYLTLKGWAEQLSLGYKVEHARCGLQVAIAVTLAMLLVVISPASNALANTAIWTVITVTILLESTVGSAVFRAVEAMGGAALGTAVAFVCQGITLGICGTLEYDIRPVAVSITATALQAVCVFALAASRMRFSKYDHLWQTSLFVLILLMVEGLTDDETWLDRSKLFVCVIIGVGITFLVSMTIFPVRARQLLQRTCATSLERMANLSFDILGELCQEPDQYGRLQGSSGTDDSLQFVDSGLQEKYDKLHQACTDLGAKFRKMELLMRAALAERYMCSQRRLPAKKIKSTSRAAQRILTQLTVLLHAYETGTMRVRLCWRHLEQLQAVRTGTSAALTALSGLVYKTVSGEYAETKVRELADSVSELQAAMDAEVEGGLCPEVETLASILKMMVSVACQVTLLFCELQPQSSAALHTHVTSVLRGCVAAPLSQASCLSYSAVQAPAAPKGGMWGPPEGAVPAAALTGSQEPAAAPQAAAFAQGTPAAVLPGYSRTLSLDQARLKAPPGSQHARSKSAVEQGQRRRPWSLGTAVEPPHQRLVHSSWLSSSPSDSQGPPAAGRTSHDSADGGQHYANPLHRADEAAWQHSHVGSAPQPAQQAAPATGQVPALPATPFACVQPGWADGEAQRLRPGWEEDDRPPDGAVHVDRIFATSSSQHAPDNPFLSGCLPPS